MRSGLWAAWAKQPRRPGGLARLALVAFWEGTFTSRIRLLPSVRECALGQVRLAREAAQRSRSVVVGGLEGIGW
jgi:hypothetical protein